MSSRLPAPGSTLSGKTALVTGAARGIGRERCRQLAARGAHVIVATRDEGRARVMADGLRADGRQAFAIKLDVTSERDRRAAFAVIAAAHGKLDILVNVGVWLDSADAGTPGSSLVRLRSM